LLQARHQMARIFRDQRTRINDFPSASAAATRAAALRLFEPGTCSFKTRSCLLISGLKFHQPFPDGFFQKLQRRFPPRP
jgi:hypothetical protein